MDWGVLDRQKTEKSLNQDVQTSEQVPTVPQVDPKPTSWLRRLAEDEQAPAKKETPWWDYPLGVGEAAAHLGWTGAAWGPSAAIALLGTGIESAISASKTDPREKSTPEDRRKLGESVMSAYMPPEPKTETGKKIVEKVGAGFEYILDKIGVNKVDQFMSKKFGPDIGWGSRVLTELAIFKLAHSAGKISVKESKKIIDKFKASKNKKLQQGGIELEALLKEDGIKNDAWQQRFDKILNENEAILQAEYANDLKKYQEKSGEIKSSQYIPESPPIKEWKKGKPTIKQMKAKETLDPDAQKILDLSKEVSRRTRKQEPQIDPEKELSSSIGGKIIEETPSGQKLNIDKHVAQELQSNLSVAEDMGIYATIKEMIGEKAKVGEILKHIKSGEYYKKDLKDLGFIEKDIRKAIQAVKIQEFGDSKAIKDLQRSMQKDIKSVEGISETVPEVSENIQRVDPEIGREPGVEAPIKPESPTLTKDILDRHRQDSQPIRMEDGNIARSEFMAQRSADQQGLVGELYKDPNSEGWLVKPTKEQQALKAKQLQKEWEDRVKEADEESKYTKESDSWDDLLDIKDPQLSKSEGFKPNDIWNNINNERGEIVLDPQALKKVLDFIKIKGFNNKDALSLLRSKGISETQISELFPKGYKAPSVQKLNTVEGSKWLKPGQNPLEYIPKRINKKGMTVPRITRMEAHKTATVKEISSRFLGEHLSFENPLRSFEKLGDYMKELIYRPHVLGEKLRYQYLKDLRKTNRKIRKSLKWDSPKRIMTYAIAQQVDGLAVLKQQGITKIPKLRPKELIAYESMRKMYEDLYQKFNKALVMSGEKPFPKESNYFTWVQEMSTLEKLKGITMFDDFRTIESGLAEIRLIPKSRFSKFRAGADRPRKLSLDPFKVMDIYANSVSKVIFHAPHLSKVAELLTEKFRMAERAPNTYNFLKQWRNFQAGKIPKWGTPGNLVNVGLQKLNRNVVWSWLSFNTRSAAIQPTAMRNAFTELGSYYTASGIHDLFRPAKFSLSRRELIGREFEVGVHDSLLNASHFVETIAKAGLKPLQEMDMITAQATWLGAYRKARKVLKYERQKAKNYAHDTVVRTQASASSADISPIQRTTIGKTITALQTFVINDFGFLTKDVLGINNARLDNKTRLLRVSRYLVATTLLNYLYEDLMKVNSPNPTPFKVYRETMETTGDSYKAWSRTLKEISEVIPIIGGNLKFESSVGGPVITELQKALRDGDITAVISLIGVPGLRQVLKSYRAYEKDGTAADIIMGRSIKEPKKYKGLGG